MIEFIRRAFVRIEWNEIKWKTCERRLALDSESKQQMKLEISRKTMPKTFSHAHAESRFHRNALRFYQMWKQIILKIDTSWTMELATQWGRKYFDGRNSNSNSTETQYEFIIDMTNRRKKSLICFWARHSSAPSDISLCRCIFLLNLILLFLHCWF